MRSELYKESIDRQFVHAIAAEVQHSHSYWFLGDGGEVCLKVTSHALYLE